jgi:hypothetical protein
MLRSNSGTADNRSCRDDNARDRGRCCFQPPGIRTLARSRRSNPRALTAIRSQARYRGSEPSRVHGDPTLPR